jgi:hypothetical protein
LSARLFVIVMFLLAWHAAGAAGLRAGVASLEADGIVVQGIEVEILPQPGAAQYLRLSIEKAAIPGLDLAVQSLRAECPLQAEAGNWRCAGQGRLASAPAAAPLSAEFVAVLEQGRLKLDLVRGPARLSLAQSGDGEAAAWQLKLRQLPLDWLAGLLRGAWPSLTKLDGELGIDASLPTAGLPTAGAPLQVDYSLRNAGFDSSDGSSAAAQLGVAGKLSWRADGKSWRLDHDGQLSGGELLLGSFHARLADHGTRLGFRLRPADGQGYQIESLHLDDPGVLDIQGSAHLAAQPPLLRAARFEAALSLPAAQQRYLQGPLGLAGWAELTSSGRVVAQASLDASGVDQASLRLEQLDLAETRRGIAVEDLSGQLAWARQGDAAPGELAWQSAQVYSLLLGTTRTRWQGRDGELALAAPSSIPLLGGALELLSLRLHPLAASGERLQASLAVHDVELARLSQALGWPRFGGKLGGAVPQLRYVDQRLDMAGGLMLNVFNGTLNVTELALERPFGLLPALSATIDFSNLDLSLVTGTFDIGEISGLLSGHVRGLRLSDWQPVAFDAQLQALGGGRISQRAVKTISSVGGGGIAAGLQASMLRLFDTFGYARLGLGCRLENTVCHMRGLDAQGSQYTLVEGRGLPRIQIVGHQSQVDWAVLVDRLKAAASGTQPVIN